MSLKNKLRRFSIIYFLHIFFHRLKTVFLYRYYCFKYNSASWFDVKKFIYKISSENSSQKKYQKSCTFDKTLRVFYIGTNFYQDTSGFLNELQEKVDLVHYKGVFNKGELDFPQGTSDIEDVRIKNSKQILLEFEAAYNYKPINYIFGQMWNYLVPVEVLKYLKQEYKIGIVNIAMDDRHSFHGRILSDKSDGGVFGLLSQLDLCCTAAPECVKWYEYYNKKAIFLPEASSPIVFHKKSVEKEFDVVFIGSNYGFRAELINYLKQNGVNIYCRGNGWDGGQVSNDDAVLIFNKAKIILGIGGILHCRHFNALKLRDFDAPMTGSFYLPQFNPDLHLLFEDNHELVCWKDKKDLLGKIRYYLKYDEEREKVANNCYEKALKCHQWSMRIDTILENISHE
jgi:hypothetical protein